jgi:hypothetical protein
MDQTLVEQRTARAATCSCDTATTTTRQSRPCARVHRNLAPYQRFRRIEFKTVPRSFFGKIRRINLRFRENACEADGLTQEYRDRYRLVRMGLTTPQRKKVTLACGSHGVGGVKYRSPARLCLAAYASQYPVVCSTRV